MILRANKRRAWQMPAQRCCGCLDHRFGMPARWPGSPALPVFRPTDFSAKKSGSIAGMKVLRYKVEFLCPAFLGNAEQNGQWRTPPFKALLRQWWRVV